MAGGTLYRQDGYGTTFFFSEIGVDGTNDLAYREFFYFDVSSITNASSAYISYSVSSYDSPDASENIVIRDVSATNIGPLKSNADGVPYYDDLGSGAVYGSTTVNLGESYPGDKIINLNATALNLINSNNEFQIGVALDTASYTGSHERLMTSPANIRLVLEISSDPPSITAPADIIVEATGPTTPQVLGTPTVLDDIGTPSVTNDAPAQFPIGATIVTWTAEDSDGNTATDQQTITVQDTTAPVFGVLSPLVIEATGATTTYSPPNPSVTDLVGVQSLTHDGPADYPLGDTTITWTATDAAGNDTTAVQTVTIQDTTPPVITLPTDLVVTATGALTSVSIGMATANDVVGVTILTNDAPAEFPVGVTQVTWSAEDAAGNIASEVQAITVESDTVAPVVTPPVDITIDRSGTLTPVNIGSATATDNVGVISVSSNAPVPSEYPLGVTQVTWTAVDAQGNTGTAIQTITVVDTTPPVLGEIGVRDTLGSPISADQTGRPLLNLTSEVWLAVAAAEAPGTNFEVTVTGEDGTSVYGSVPVAWQSVPEEVQLSVNNAVLFPNDGEVYIVTFTATDQSGNDSSESIEVVVDRAPPSIGSIQMRSTFPWPGLIVPYREEPDGSFTTTGYVSEFYIDIPSADAAGVTFRASTRNLTTATDIGSIDLTYNESLERVAVRANNTSLFPGYVQNDIELSIIASDGINEIVSTAVVHYDRIGEDIQYPVEIIGVYDPDGTGNSVAGFPDYQGYYDGIVVNQSVTDILYRVPIQYAYPESVWGINETQDLNNVSTARLGEDATYAYYTSSNIEIDSVETKTYNARLFDRAGNTISKAVVLAGSADITLAPNFVSLLPAFNDTTVAPRWATVTDPDSITYFYVEAEPRPVDQLVEVSTAYQNGTVLVSYIIPAGEVAERFIPLDPSLSLDWVNASNNFYGKITLQMPDGSTESARRNAYFGWDKDAPVLNEVTYDDPSRRFTVSATDRARASDNDRYWAFYISGWQGALSTDGSVWRNMRRSNTVEDPRGEYSAQFRVDTVPDGFYYNSRFRVTDNHGNVSNEINIPVDLTVDQRGPTIIVYKDESRFDGGSFENGTDEFSFELRDVIGGEELVSVRLSGGILGSSIDMPVTQNNDGLYLLGNVPLTSSTYAGPYTLRIEATDISANVSVRNISITFDPEVVGDRVSDEVFIPAIDNAFTDVNGEGWLRSEVIVGLVGMQDTIVLLDPDATGSFIVNGVIVNPGDRVNLGDLDYDASGGRYVADIQPVTPGVIQTGVLTFANEAVEIPPYLVRVTTWLPEVAIESRDWTISQAIEKYTISAVASQTTPCRLTSDISKAADADMARDPMCLLQWEAIPDEGGITLLDPGYVQGWAFALGEQLVEATISIVDGDGTPYEVLNLQQFITVVPETYEFEFAALADDEEYAIRVEEVTAIARQVDGPFCMMLVSSENVAQPHCLATWNGLPADVVQDPARREPALRGAIQEIGDYPINFTMQLVSATGQTLDIGGDSTVLRTRLPDTPVIDFYPRQTADGRNIINREGGLAGNIIITASGASLNYSTQYEGEDTADYFFYQYYRRGGNAIAKRYIYADEYPIWTEKNLTVYAEYADMPEVNSSRDISMIWGPPSRMKGSIELTDAGSSVTNTATTNFTVSLTEPDEDNIYSYSEQRLGQWRVRLVTRDSQNNIVPITDYQNLGPTGETQIGTDLEAYIKTRIQAEFQAITPISGFAPTYLSDNQIYVTPINMESLTGSLNAYKIRGPSVLNTYFTIALDDAQYIQDIGSITWQVMNVSDGVWNTVSTDFTTRLAYQFSTGEYQVRALLTNENSGVTSTLGPVQVQAYDQVDVQIEGETIKFFGDTFNLTATTTVNGQPYNDVVVTWYNSETGEELGTGQTLQYVLTVDNPKVTILARARSVYAPEDQAEAFDVDYFRIQAVETLPPSAAISGPNSVETGSQSSFTAVVNQPYTGIEYPYTGFWTLPNGERVYSSVLNWTPTATDVGGRRLTYTVFYDDYRAQGAEATYDYYVNVWEYIWPEFGLQVRQQYEVAPDIVVLTVNGANGYYVTTTNLLQYQYEWTVPDGVEITRGEDSYQIYADVAAAGSYPISVRIRDGRGNTRNVSMVLEVGNPPAWNLSFYEYTKDPQPFTAPSTVRYTVRVSGGHPADRVDNYYWYQYDNGSWLAQNVDDGRYAATSYTGEYDQVGTNGVRVRAQSRLGISRTLTEIEDVAENQRPNCSIVKEPYSFYRPELYNITANCSDPDGYVKRYEWTIDGVSYPGSIFNYRRASLYEPDANVRLVVTDDRGLTRSFNYTLPVP